MLDFDLAMVYGVTTTRLNEQVKRNQKRFPPEFMFQLTPEEFENLISQNATSSWGGRRKLPFAFTEHGALMAAIVLNTETAIQASIFVVKAFVELRNAVRFYRELEDKLTELERKTVEQFKERDSKIQQLFDAFRRLLQKDQKPRRPIGFHNNQLEDI